MTIQSIRHRLISRINRINDPEILEKLASVMDGYSDAEAEANLKALIKPIEKTLDIEKLAKEQGYKGISDEKMDEIIKKVNFTESLEELLAMI